MEPKWQYSLSSKFHNGMIVARTNEEEEFPAMIKKANDFMDEVNQVETDQRRKEEMENFNPNAPMCQKPGCGGSTKFVEGVSAKNGRKWKADECIRCANRVFINEKKGGD